MHLLEIALVRLFRRQAVTLVAGVFPHVNDRDAWAAVVVSRENVVCLHGWWLFPGLPVLLGTTISFLPSEASYCGVEVVLVPNW